MPAKLFSTFSLRLKATGITLAIVTFALTIMAGAGIVQIHQQIFIEQHRGASIVARGVYRAVDNILRFRDWDHINALLPGMTDSSVCSNAVFF